MRLSFDCLPTHVTFGREKESKLINQPMETSETRHQTLTWRSYTPRGFSGKAEDVKEARDVRDSASNPRDLGALSQAVVDRDIRSLRHRCRRKTLRRQIAEIHNIQ